MLVTSKGIYLVVKRLYMAAEVLKINNKQKSRTKFSNFIYIKIFISRFCLTFIIPSLRTVALVLGLS
jgi:hypothetical protein